MRALRAALAGIVVAAALLGVARTQWSRFACNREKRAAEGLLDRLQTIASDFQRQDAARGAAARMERCVAETPGDWQVHFLLATLQAPLQQLVQQLNAPAQNLVYVLEARRKQLEEQS